MQRQGTETYGPQREKMGGEEGYGPLRWTSSVCLVVRFASLQSLASDEYALPCKPVRATAY